MTLLAVTPLRRSLTLVQAMADFRPTGSSQQLAAWQQLWRVLLEPNQEQEPGSEDAEANTPEERDTAA